MHTFWRHLQKIFCILSLAIFLSACGNEIKTDLIHLDSAMVEDADLEENIQTFNHAQNAQETREATQQIRDSLHRYTQALANLDFQSDEVRQLRDELLTETHRIILALDDMERMNVHDNMQVDEERYQEIQAEAQRTSKQIAQAQANIQNILRKMQALGADNGVQIVIE